MLCMIFNLASSTRMLTISSPCRMSSCSLDICLFIQSLFYMFNFTMPQMEIVKFILMKFVYVWQQLPCCCWFISMVWIWYNMEFGVGQFSSQQTGRISEKRRQVDSDHHSRPLVLVCRTYWGDMDASVTITVSV